MIAPRGGVNNELARCGTVRRRRGDKVERKVRAASALSADNDGMCVCVCADCSHESVQRACAHRERNRMVGHQGRERRANTK